MSSYLDQFGIDHWNSSVDGELNPINFGNKLKNKYGHRFEEVKVPKGQYLPNHTHDHTKADAIFSGHLELIIVDEKSKQERQFILKDGDIFYLPAETVHSARAFTDCIFYDSYK